MIQNSDIQEIIETAKSDGFVVTEKDIAVLVMCERIADRSFIFRMIYNAEPIKEKIGEYMKTDKVRYLASLLNKYGVGEVSEAGISREENKLALQQNLIRLKKLEEEGRIEAKDSVKMEIEIRTKLNDKFDMEEEDGSKHLIRVPIKHDIICPHTNRECTYMPTREACIKYYKLNE